MTAQTKTLITGVTGQEGAYLAELLLDKSQIVHDIKHRTSLFGDSTKETLIKPVRIELVEMRAR